MEGNEIFVFKPFHVHEIPRDKNWPIARSGHSIVWGRNKLYLMGGYNSEVDAQVYVNGNNEPCWTSELPLFKEIISWDPHNSWKHIPIEILPDQLVSLTLSFYRNTIVVFGGTGWPFGQSSGNDFWMMKLSDANKKLEQISNFTGSFPNPNYGHSAFFHDKYFYKIGGTCGYFYNCDIHRLNLETLSWEILYQNLNNNQQPEGRYKHEVAFYKEKIYILGGGNSIDTFDLANIPIFDLNTNQWEIVTSSPDPAFPDRGYPKPRKFFSAIQTSVEENEYMFVIGGSNGSHPWKDVWRLNLSCLKWKKMEKTFLPKPLFFHSSCVTPAGCAYIFGGSRLKRYETIRTNRLYKVWLRIPKLSEICWEAIVYYVPTLKMINKLDLLALGIPSEFINRLDEN